MSYYNDFEDCFDVGYDEDFECFERDEDFDNDDRDDFDDEDDRSMFANPGGNSALRAATASNPRIYSCPECGEPNRLTAKDVQLGYQCDSCADRDEGGGY